MNIKNTEMVTIWKIIDLFFKIVFIFRETGREGEREGEKHLGERETSISCFLYAPQPGTIPATLACALTRNRTGDFFPLQDDRMMPK